MIDVEPDEHMLVQAPGELIDIVELSPLTLRDRHICNLADLVRLMRAVAQLRIERDASEGDAGHACLQSKYAMALYEMVQKRGNLKFKTGEEFPVDRFRSLPAVEPDKLREFKHSKHQTRVSALSGADAVLVVSLLFRG
jgi:hypothetical protein